MPGGSNSGRPFRDDPTSYTRTGIPCGNPKRFQSRGVIRMAPSGTPYRDQRMEAPLEEIETEGQRQLQELLKKQLNTNVTLDEQLKRRKTFTEAVVYKSTSASGQLSLQEYQALGDHEKRVEELKQCGLTEDEIALKLEDEEIQTTPRPAKQSRYGIDPLTHHARMIVINQKIEDKKKQLAQQDTFSGVKYMSRHEMDLERAISHDPQQAKLLSCLMAKQKPDNSDTNNPVNNLDRILEGAWMNRRQIHQLYTSHKIQEQCEQCSGGGSSVQDASVTMSHCWKCSARQIQSGQVQGPLTKEQIELLNRTNESNQGESDSKKTSSHGKETSMLSIEGKCSETADKGSETVSNLCEESGPRKVQGTVENIPEESIKKYKLTLEQIRQIPRFKDYSPGNPSKTLFLKNLSNKVTESDLVGLFLRFEKPAGPKVVFRLLTGRMKGQAFVTFDSEETAKQALELVNGYDLKGKSIVIQYGKKATSS